LVNFGDWIYTLEQIGFLRYIIPFLLAFSIIFGILEKIKLFGDGKSNIHLIVSLLLGFTIVSNTNLLDFLNSYLSNFTLMIILFFILILILQFFLNLDNAFLKWGTVGLAIIASIWLLFESEYSPFGSGYGLGGSFYNFYYYFQPYIDVLLILGVIGLVILFVYSSFNRDSKGD
tara:strand:+ start:757 stop:1278 length:522 start_codon:yes stop_codon:yes gene_type:complete